MMKREVIIMGVVQATQKDVELLARLMRAEAESDGEPPPTRYTLVELLNVFGVAFNSDLR